MARLGRRIEAVDHDLALRWIVQFVLYAIVARNAIALGNVERALAERDSIRRVEALENGLDLALAVSINHRVHVLGEAVAHEHGALVAERERARLGNAIDPDFHLESCRHFQLVDRKPARRPACHLRRKRVQGRLRLLWWTALLPRWRCGRCGRLRRRSCRWGWLRERRRGCDEPRAGKRRCNQKASRYGRHGMSSFSRCLLSSKGRS